MQKEKQNGETGKYGQKEEQLETQKRAETEVSILPQLNKEYVLMTVKTLAGLQRKDKN